MKKILFVITKSNWGGAQRYVFDLATSLPKKDFDVTVALGGSGKANAAAGLLEQKLAERNIPTLFVSAFMRDISLSKEYAALQELVTLFTKEKPDIVHLNSSKAGGIGALAARLAGVKKIIFTSHGLAWDEDRHIVSRALIYLATRATFLLCHEVITITSDNYYRAQKCLLCKKNIHLVHNGIAQGTYLSQTEARAKLGIPEGVLALGGIGELTWNKGWHYALRAMSILKRKGIAAQLYIIGGGEEKTFIKTILEEEDIADRVTLLGFIPDAASCVKAFDIFLLPSVKEGLPYVLLEAGQAVLPVIASNTGGVPDIVGNKVSGLLVKPKDSGALADALLNLIQHKPERDQYASNLYNHTANEFTLEKMVAKTIEVYGV